MAQPQKPSLNAGKLAQGPRSSEQYLKQLEDLLKRNTGSGIAVGQDTSSNIPMYIPGKVANPSGIGAIAPSVAAYGNGMLQPAPVERQAPMQVEEPPVEEPITIEEFLTQFDQAYNDPQNQPGFGNTEVEGIASTVDGGIMGADGTIFYDDGTVRKGDPRATGIQSLADGGIKYSDGSVRRPAPTAIQSVAGDRERIKYDDGSMRYGQYQYEQGQPISGGLSGLMQSVFGQEQTITQPFGNYNPELEPGSGINYGTDFRTRDLRGSMRDFKLPVDAEVVEVLQDDGTRWGDISGHQGYGNSILVRMPSGEMLRFSHLSSMAQVQPGQVIRAGEVFGTPGATGNTTGEHLDLEYYNAQGQLSNPNQFVGFTDPKSLRTPIAGQPAPGTEVPQSEQRMMSQEPSQPAPQQEPMRAIAEPVQQAIAPVVNQAAKTTKNALETALPDDKLEVGLTEGLVTPAAKQARQETVLSGQAGPQNPFRQLAGNVLEKAGDTLGIPEGSFSELVAGGKTRRTNLANASDGNMLSLPEELTDEKYEPTLLGDATRVKDAALSKAGEGLSGLKDSGTASLENVFRPVKEKVARAVGDVSGTVSEEGQPQFSSLMDTASSRIGLKNDNRDAFFKQGGSEIYKNFLKPNAESLYGGALSLDLFNDDFYKDLGNISSVFGGSKDMGAASDKFLSYEREKYRPMDRMGYSDEYDRGSVDDYNREVDKYNASLNDYFSTLKNTAMNAKSIFVPSPRSGAKNIFAVPQVQASSALMSKAPAMSMARPSAATRMTSAPRPASRPSSSPSMTPANANMSTNRGPAVAPAPKRMASPQVSTPAKANMSTNRGPQIAPAPRKYSAPAPQSKPKSNVFSTVTRAISNIFRR